MSDTNHNQPEIDPELLSAFYDGETSAEERAFIEQFMDISPDTLQTLDDYDQLTQGLRQLHQSTQSPDLRDPVLARIAGAQPSLAQEAAGISSARRVRMISIAASSLAVAALVLVLVWPNDPAAPIGDGQQAIALREVDQATADIDEPSPAAAPMSDAAGTAPAPPSRAEMEAGIDNALSLSALASKRPALEPGDVIRYLSGNADEITWVTVTVVNVQSAGDQVQLLLRQHGVESPASADALKQERQQAGDQYLLLVEADWEQLGAVIVDLNDQQFVNELEVDAPAAEGVPVLLQGFQMVRNAKSGQAESNKDIGSLRQQGQQSLTARSSASSSSASEAGADANGKQQTASNAIQLPAAVSDAEWQRLAAQRGDQAESPLGELADSTVAAEPKPSAADEAVTSARSTFGMPLGRPRAKTVFVIQESDE